MDVMEVVAQDVSADVSEILEAIADAFVPPEAAVVASSETLHDFLVVSKYAVGIGILAAVGDACLQGISILLEPYCKRREGKGINTRSTDSETRRHWQTAKTFRGFVYGGTAGVLLSAARMIFTQRLPLKVILPQVIPCELLLLPFQYIIYRQQEAHLTQNIASYMLIYTLANLTVYVPTYLCSKFYHSNMIMFIALSVQQMWIGFCALGLLFFFNRYHKWQWRLPLPEGSSKVLAFSNQCLIYGAHLFGNISVVFLLTEVMLVRSRTFPFTIILPLWFAQILVNSQLQLAVNGQVSTFVRALRIGCISLAIPACNMRVSKWLPTVEPLANVLAFSGFSLWIGTFNKEWKELYDEIEGAPRFDPSWRMDKFLEAPTNPFSFPFANLFNKSTTTAGEEDWKGNPVLSPALGPKSVP